MSARERLTKGERDHVERMHSVHQKYQTGRVVGVAFVITLGVVACIALLAGKQTLANISLSATIAGLLENIPRLLIDVALLIYAVTVTILWRLSALDAPDLSEALKYLQQADEVSG